MKIGLRTPSLEKSFKARTTGRLKRQMKKSVNPLYGKKGMGLINNPKKAIYNKIYSKTTIDPLSGIKNLLKNQLLKMYKLMTFPEMMKRNMLFIISTTLGINGFILLLPFYLVYLAFSFSTPVKHLKVLNVFCFSGLVSHTSIHYTWLL